MDFKENFQKAFWVLITCVGIVLSGVGSYLAVKVDKMSDSVIELNGNIKHLFFRVDLNTKKIESQDYRIRDNENRIKTLELQK